MNVRRNLRVAWSLGQIAGTLAGGLTAPPPADLPQYLNKQYGTYAKTKPAEIRAEVSRLTTTSRRPTTSLTKRDARRLRGK